MYYKYRPWNDYTKDIFTSNSLYYSDANSFNDLHECVVSPEPKSKVSGHSSLIFDARKNYRILCLSKEKNNYLMWAHYADSCKGICFEFDFHSDDPHFNKPLKITYQDTPPIVTDAKLQGRGDISSEMFLYKNKLWEYENEWRIFKPNKEPFKVPFHVSSLKSIYIGPPSVSAPIFDDVKKHINEYNQINKTSVRLVRLQRRAHSYIVDEEVIF